MADDIMTYWGDERDGVELCCHSCDKTFLAREHVTREYSVKKLEEADEKERA